MQEDLPKIESTFPKFEKQWHNRFSILATCLTMKKASKRDTVYIFFRKLIEEIPKICPTVLTGAG